MGISIGWLDPGWYKGSNSMMVAIKDVDEELRQAGLGGIKVGVADLRIAFFPMSDDYDPGIRGVKPGRFSRKSRKLLVRIGISDDEMLTLHPRTFVINRLRQAIMMAESRFERHGVRFQTHRIFELLEQIENSG